MKPRKNRNHSRCFFCESEIKWIEHVDGTPDWRPKPGDNFVCVECGEVSLFDARGALHPMTVKQFLERRLESQEDIRWLVARVKEGSDERTMVRAEPATGTSAETPPRTTPAT